MNEFLIALRDSLATESFIQLVLSRPLLAESVVSKATYRPIALKAGPRVQATLTERSRETHNNLTHDDVVAAVTRQLGYEFGDANLFTTTADLSVQTKPNSKLKITRRPPSKAAQTAITSHNRTKQYLIPEGMPCPFLIEIGVMTPDGKVRAAKYDKFRQMNRFLELVNDVLTELPNDRELRVVDFGCGKSYLTFALHHLLTVIHQRKVEIIGLDLKRDVIEHCSTVARKLNCAGLTFQVGDIAAHEETSTVDLTVSLHACDTATDAAIAKAVGWNAKVILCVPCCQHEFAQEMTGTLLQPLQRHGILKERFAALATDALRAQALEVLGYRTQVVEFIDLEHTPKNLLIRAVQRALEPSQLPHLVENYQICKQELGLGDIALERLLSDSQRRRLNGTFPDISGE